jgi:RHS repeat-associated protein
VRGQSYTYNADSEIIQVSVGSCTGFVYDGDGNRLMKANQKIYWYGAGTEILDESDTSGNFTNEYVFFGGRRIAMRNVSSGTIDYYEEDMLGSSRTLVQAGATSPCFDADFLPFGYEKDVTTTCSQNYKFEGKERDTETNNDDFGARYYSSQYGRWLSADWSSVPAPVPYANLSNPQTLNLYAMVSDNPESFADLDGHCQIDVDCIFTVWGFQGPKKATQGGNNQTTQGPTCSSNSGSSACTKNVTAGAAPAQSQQTGIQQNQQAANNHTKQDNKKDQDSNKSQAKTPLPPQADPAAQNAKYQTRPVKPDDPPTLKQTPNPTDPAPDYVPGAGSKAPMGTVPATDPTPNPEYMTTGQRIVFVIGQVIKSITSGAESFFIIAARPSPCPNDPNGCA